MIRHRKFGAIAMLALLGACATTAPAPLVPPVTVAAVGQISPALPYPKGYLAPSALPDSLALLPPPPAPGSVAMEADQEAFREGVAASPERFALATSDADLHWPHAVQSYEQVVGFSLSDGTKPHTEMLLRRALTDAAMSTSKAKANYQRVRPFVLNKVQSCTPADEASLSKDGSYPSGHTAIGWMLALVLTDLVPAKTDALLKRGYEFGDSRIVCRVHWKSDTVAGRVMASATFARLQADPVFQAQRELARAELAKQAAR
ncbi:acid phosphatase [Sandaracinobacter neustonicus]|nr:phosphatase PAP2 family protein [Sandaracinobacter neustonicus]